MRPRQTIVSVLLFTTAPLLPACVTDGIEEQQQMQNAPRDLVELRSELAATPADQALARIDHFRPLCDDQGYPLVGNIANKGVGLQPSEFCAEVRNQQNQ